MIEYIMAAAKKLTFAPFFLISYFFLLYRLPAVFKSADLIFSFSSATFIQLVIIAGLIIFSSLSFVLFSSLALNWKLVLPMTLLSAILPFIFFDAAIGLILGIGIFVILLLSFLSLNQTMKTYFTFQPASIFGPSIRHLTGMLILLIAVNFFLVINKEVAQNGFQIPDSLIDAALKFAPLPQTDGVEQLNELIKQTVKDQVQNLIKPYINFIPAILALLLFLTLQSLTSIINLLIYPLLWLIFLILEKSGFIKFTEEMRPVKKMLI